LDPFWEITRPGYSRGQIPLLIDVSDEDRDLAFVNIQKAARHYGVNLSEGSWHDLGIHRRKRRKAPPDAL
jgi:hypothetical protein